MSVYSERILCCLGCEHQVKRRCMKLDQPIPDVASTPIWRCPLIGTTPGAAGPVPVDVVITCHNYGRFLKECIDSVLDQTVIPASVLVIDDSSADHTPAICQEYAGRIVSKRVEFRDVVQARRLGLDHGDAEFVLFVDADNRLKPTYLQTAVAAVDSINVVCVYADLERFGDSTGTLKTPEHFDGGRLAVQNFVDTCSLLRRSALELLDLPRYWDKQPDPLTSEDYVLAQSLARIGGQFRKHSTPLEYRVHAASETIQLRGPREAAPFLKSHGIDLQSIDLFIPLAGRAWAWDTLAAYLDRQTFPADRIRLTLCDTSQNESFGRRVRSWLAQSKYHNARYFTMEASRPGLADMPRINVEREINLAMCRIYNRMRAEITSEYVWILEDDIEPPDDVAERLLDRFAGNVASVFAPYPSRFALNHVCWTGGYPGRDPWDAIHHPPPPPPDQSQLADVDGNGFGCLMLRAATIRDHLFQLPAGHRYYDPHFYATLPAEWRRLVDWTCLSKHHNAPAD